MLHLRAASSTGSASTLLQHGISAAFARLTSQSGAAGRAYSSSAPDGEVALKAENVAGLPDPHSSSTQAVEDEPEELREERKQRVIRLQLATDVIGYDPELAKLLQQHGVIVRGGAEQAKTLMAELLAWRDKKRP